jgi:hypothetical protein
VLDQRFPSRVDDRSAASAAAEARRQRGLEDGDPAAERPTADDGHQEGEGE